MKDRAVDDLVPRPEGGLMPYREAVRRALGRVNDDAIETSWQGLRGVGRPQRPAPSDPEWAGRLVYTDERTMRTSASPAQLWSVIEGIGGENGWYSSPLLWAIRGWMDRLVGGVGLARGRRSRSVVTVGDALDFWRVEAIEPGHLLRLRAEMKVPGGAWLELRASPDGAGARFDQRALFFPTGLAGRLYWLSVLPFHGLIFSGMARRITAAAESVQRDDLEPRAKAGRIPPEGPRSRPSRPRPTRAPRLERCRTPLTSSPCPTALPPGFAKTAAVRSPCRCCGRRVSTATSGRRAGRRDNVEAALRAAVASGAGLVVTTGGTGIAPTDRTPEGTARVLDRELPASPRSSVAADSPTPRSR